MGSNNDSIDHFLKRVGRRLNQSRLLSALVSSLLVVSIVTLVVASWYVFQGYAVNRWLYVIAPLTAIVSAAMQWVMNLANQESSAKFADKFYDLKDGLISYLHFSEQGKTDGVYELQHQQTVKKIEPLETNVIERRPPSKKTLLAVSLACIAFALMFMKPSQAVQERLELEDFTLQQTEAIQEEFQEILRELNEQVIDPLEREMIDPDKLREMVDSLDVTKDQKQALRQLGKLEKELNKKLTSLEQKKDEHLLSKAAEELKKARETKALAKTIENKDYKKAAEELADMKPKEAEKLSEQRKEMAKLAAASKKMAAAVRNQRNKSSSGSSSQSASKGDSKNASSSSSSGKGGSANGSGGKSGGKLGEAIEDLDQAMEEWSKSLSEAELQETTSGECDSECKSRCSACKSNALSQLSKLQKYLNKMAVKKEASSKLCKLCKSCSQCQSGLCNSQCASSKNGLGIGASVNYAERSETDELVDNGNTETLKGIKGQGPSLSTVETADEGTGTSGRATAAKARTFKRQFESYVEREDVPEDVRLGVKRYFESIHQIEESR